MSCTARVAVLVTVVATLALGGCRGAATASPPAGHVTSADPLGSVETRLDQIEKQVEQDGTG